MAYGAILGQTPSGFAPLEGLPTNDVRNLTIASGYSVNAGDIVDLDENNNVYINVTPQANVEKTGISSAVSATCIEQLTEDKCIAFFVTSSYGYITVITGETESSFAENGVSNISHASISKLTEQSIVKQYITGTTLYANVCTIVGTSGVSFNTTYTISSSVSNSEKIIAFSDSLALSIYNSSGLKCKVLPISGTTITTSGTVYSLPNNTGANYISACRLPDEGGNKRVCIAFSDTGDGKKGKAVIATISSSNVVTFGSVKTFENSAVSSISCDTDGNAILVNTSDSLILLDMSLNVLSSATSTSGAITNVSANTYAFLGTNNNACVVKTSGNAVSKGDNYAVNGGSNTKYPSIAATSENGVIAAYSDAGNSNYGTTTVLEILGNQIAGSFIDNSKDAIALADGTGGQSIPVGFGGYCQCDGVTEGQQITSDGVSAFSPLDGWLMISYAQEKLYFTGDYTGTGYENVIDIGRPVAILFLRHVGGNNECIIATPISTICWHGSYFESDVGSITFTDTGVIVEGGVCGKLNNSYKYIAIARG